MNDSEEKIRTYLFHSPKFNTGRIGSDQQITSQSTRIKKPTTKIYPKVEKVFAQLAFLKDFDCQILHLTMVMFASLNRQSCLHINQQSNFKTLNLSLFWFFFQSSFKTTVQCLINGNNKVSKLKHNIN